MRNTTITTIAAITVLLSLVFVIALLVIVVLVVLSVLIALMVSLLLYVFLVLPVLQFVLLSSPLPRGRLTLSPAALAAVLVGRGCWQQRAPRSSRLDKMMPAK